MRPAWCEQRRLRNVDNQPRSKAERHKYAPLTATLSKLSRTRKPNGVVCHPVNESSYKTFIPLGRCITDLRPVLTCSNWGTLGSVAVVERDRVIYSLSNKV